MTPEPTKSSELWSVRLSATSAEEARWLRRFVDHLKAGVAVQQAAALADRDAKREAPEQRTGGTDGANS